MRLFGVLALLLAGCASAPRAPTATFTVVVLDGCFRRVPRAAVIVDRRGLQEEWVHVATAWTGRDGRAVVRVPGRATYRMVVLAAEGEQVVSLRPDALSGSWTIRLPCCLFEPLRPSLPERKLCPGVPVSPGGAPG